MLDEALQGEGLQSYLTVRKSGRYVGSWQVDIRYDKTEVGGLNAWDSRRSGVAY